MAACRITVYGWDLQVYNPDAIWHQTGSTVQQIMDGDGMSVAIDTRDCNNGVHRFPILEIISR